MVTEQDKTGGSAFPHLKEETIYSGAGDRYGRPEFVPQDGMTLRDYFAAKAMAAIITSQPDSGHCRILESNVAEHAYELADAMLEARK
jgi:hypothetical protein